MTKLQEWSQVAEKEKHLINNGHNQDGRKIASCERFFLLKAGEINNCSTTQ